MQFHYTPLRCCVHDGIMMACALVYQRIMMVKMQIFFLYIPLSPNLADATYLMRLKEPSADEQKQWKEKPKMPFGV